jgi:putative glutathione S-transferase
MLSRRESVLHATFVLKTAAVQERQQQALRPRHPVSDRWRVEEEQVVGRPAPKPPADSHGSGIMARIKALIDGVWHGDLEETPEVREALKTRAHVFRSWITPDGSPGPTGEGGFPAESGRYHIYVSYACPWAHRAILYRRLKGLENVISISVLHPQMGDARGWRFGESDMSTSDRANGRNFLYEVYQLGHPGVTSRVTVPTLWDTKQGIVVNKESGDIIRMLNSAFDAWGNSEVDFYPADLREEIDAMNAVLLPKVCAGVYRAGFARSQATYDASVRELFDTLDWLEERLAHRPFLIGERITESDWHLFCTLARFDAAYHSALKCNLRRLVDYPALSAYARRIYELPGVSETVKFDHIMRHYHDYIGDVDPTIVPITATSPG